jgi:DHA3 family macrolide efflux protein-like MFS transporter
MKLVTYDLSRWKRLFFIIWGGQAFSLLGSALVDFALIWYMTTSTGSATILTTATLVSMVPRLLLGPILGSIVDRWKRRVMIILADSLIAAFTVLIALLFWSGSVQLWHIYILLFVRSIAGYAHGTAMYASTSLMVPNEQLTRVAGLNQTLQGLLSIAGPPLGAFLLEVLPIYGVLLIDVATAALAVLPLLFIVIPEPIKTLKEGKPDTKFNVFKDISEGFRYVQAWKGLMVLIGVAILANFLFTPLFSLTPLLVTEHFGGGAPELGWVEAAVGIGSIVGGLALGAWGGFKKRILTSMAGLIGAGVGCLMIAVSPQNTFWLAIMGFLWTGIMMVFMDGPLKVIFQAKIAPEMQGRVMSFLDSGGKIVSPLALLIAGPLTDLFDVRFWFFLAGGGVIAIGLAAFNIRTLMKIEENGPVSNPVQAVS